jgi:hypothetical protein
MAHKLLLNASQRGLLVSYYGNLQAVQALVRSFASQSGHNRSRGDVEAPAAAIKTSDEPRPLTVEPPMGLLGPMDVRLPLPGNLGLDVDLSTSGLRRPPILSGSSRTTLPPNATLLSKTDLLTSPTNHDRQVEAFRQFFAAVDEAVSNDNKKASPQVEVEHAAVYDLECSARSCTRRMKKELAPLFTDRDVRRENLTALTLSQKTVHDMSAWSEAMDNEREELTAHFITLAKEICEQLRESGHWADFVDPSSSQMYYSPHSNDTLAETDDRMRYLGLDIQDLGCCKVVFHPQWKAHVFVGCLFTNAPMDDPLIQELLSKTPENL